MGGRRYEWRGGFLRSASHDEAVRGSGRNDGSLWVDENKQVQVQEQQQQRSEERRAFGRVDAPFGAAYLRHA